MGLKSAGKIEIKPDVDGDWVEVADAAINATFADGLSASFGLADYNLGNLDLIVMDNVQGSFEMPIPAVHTATLDFTGHQVFLGLDSNTRVSMSLTEGILIDSTTVIDGLGEMAIDAHTKGTIEHWPPLGGAGGLDLETQAHFTLDLDHAAEQIHGAVNGVLSGANEAYRSALNVLNNQGHEERELHNRIGALEAEIRQRSDVINSQLRPGFDRAEDGLAQAQRHMSNVWGDIHYFERRKDDAASRCDGWPWNWEHCAEASYWLGRELASRGLVWAAGIALDVGYSVLNTSERVLNDALYEVNRVLDPRLNAYRIALVGIRAGKAVAAITVRALEVANRDVMAVSNALRDASSITVHNASASVDSLVDLLAGTRGVMTEVDISVLNMRCQSQIDVNLNKPVETMMNGIAAVQGACAADFHDDANDRQQTQMVSRYLSMQTARLQQTLLGAANEPASNDSISNAELINSSLPVTLHANNRHLAHQNNGAFDALTENTLWYQFVPTQTGLYRIVASSAEVDTSLQIHDANIAPVGSAASLLAADLIPAAEGQLVVNLQAWTGYFIGVGSQLGLSGNIALTITHTDSASAALNDAFADAIVVDGLGGSDQQLNDNNETMSTELGESAGDALAITATSWWQLDVSASGLYTLNTLGSDMDTVLRAYRLADGAPVAIDNLEWLKQPTTWPSIRAANFPCLPSKVTRCGSASIVSTAILAR